jgi:AcrR family transcriptional regulator
VPQTSDTGATALGDNAPPAPPASRSQSRTAPLRPAANGARRPGRPGYDLETLLAVAVEVFNERGYEGTSMEDLSRRLGIAKSAIYHHVSGKEELLRLSLERAMDGLYEVAKSVQRSDAAAVVRLEQLVRGSVEVLQRELPHVTLLLRLRGNTQVERDALARRRSFDRLVANLIRDAEREGDLRPSANPTITAHMLFGLVNSVVEWYRPTSRTSLPLADMICSFAFDGLRAPEPG